MNPFSTPQKGSRFSFLTKLAARPALVAFLVCLGLGLVAVGWRAKRQVDASGATAGAYAHAGKAALELQLSQAVSAAETLAALVKQGGGAIPNFQKVAADMLFARRDLATLTLEPGGIVRDIAPREGHERALGKSLAQPGPAEQWAIQNRALLVTGPQPLDRGETGFLARVPVFLRGRDGREACWGFVSASVRLSDMLAESGLEGAFQQGYTYTLFAPATRTQKLRPIVGTGAPAAGAVLQKVQAPGLELRLALWRRGGWVNKTNLLFESLGVLALSALVGLLGKFFQSGRVLEQELAAANRRAAEAGAALERAQAAGTESQARLETALRSAKESAAIAGARLKEAESKASGLLKEAESRADGLQSRLEAATREAEQAAQARKAELDKSEAARQQAQKSLAELEERLEAEKKAASAARNQSRQDQATIAELQAQMESAGRSTQEAAEANSARLQELQARNEQLKKRLAAAEKLEARLAELARLLEESEAKVRRLEEAAAVETGASAEEPVAGIRTEAPEALAAPSAAPAPEFAVEAAGEKAVSGPNGNETADVKPEPALEPSPTASAELEPASAPPAVTAEAPEEETLKKAPVKPAKRKKARRDDQMDLFGGEASEEPPRVEAVTLSPVRGGEAEESSPALAAAAPAAAEVAAAVEEPASPAVADIDLPAIEGLAVAEGLAHAKGNSKRYLKALADFVEQQAGLPEQVRDALVQGNTSQAAGMLKDLLAAAEAIGATGVSGAATALARAVQQQTDPGEIEFVWVDLEKALKHLTAELRPVLKPQENKPAPARPLPAPPPVNPALLRKAVSEILPLLTDQDPGAKDCLKANRNTFRSAFAPDAYAEFEQWVRKGEYGPALEQLKKAGKKHGLNL